MCGYALDCNSRLGFEICMLSNLHENMYSCGTIDNNNERKQMTKQGRIHGYLSRVRVSRGGEKKQIVTDRPTD